MNRNLLKLIVACGAACFIACTAPQKQKQKNGANVWHALR